MNESTNRFATLLSSNIFAHPTHRGFLKTQGPVDQFGRSNLSQAWGRFFGDADPCTRIPTFSQRVYGRTFGSDTVVFVYFFDSLQLNTKLKETR